MVIVSLILPAPTGANDGHADPTIEWWGPTEIGSGHHIRVPVTVTNPHDYPIEAGLVMAQIDVTHMLAEAGWIHEVRGNQVRLSSFDLDPNSVRVVEMFDLEAPMGSSKHGKIAAHDTRLPVDDPARFAIPSTHYEGFVVDRSAMSFDNRTNPIITVMWRIPEILEAGEERYFVVYLDSLTNRVHEPADYRDTLDGPLLYNAFWSGPGAELIGHALPRPASPAIATVIGLHANTQVTVFVADKGGSFTRQVPAAGVHTNPFTIGVDQTVKVVFGNVPTTFKLVADRPIVGLVDSEGFVPSKSGSFVGREFVYATTYAEDRSQDSIFFINQHPDLQSQPDRVQTIVELQKLLPSGQPDGPPREIHISDGVNPYHYTLGYRFDRPSSTFDCRFDETDSSPRIGPEPATYRARVTQGGPIAVEFDAVQGITQRPALEEGPSGTRFWSVLAKKIHPLDERGDCPQSVIEAYNMFAVSHRSTGLGVWSLDANDRIFPPCDAAPCELEAVGPFDEAVDFLTVDTGEFHDRPLDVRTVDPTWFMVGRTQAQTLGTLGLHGPLGGHNGAREFMSMGETLLYAPYDDTRVTIQADPSSPITVANLAKGRSIHIADISETDLRSQRYELKSNRPLIVESLTEDSAFMAAVPASLAAKTHHAEYRGYLVDIASASGLNPVTGSTIPGQKVEYEFIVTNRGHGAIGKNLPDTIALCPTGTEDLPLGWTAAVHGSRDCDTPATVTLSSGQTQTIKLVVTPPEDAQVGDQAIGVRAVSLNNPAVTDSIGTLTHLKKSYDVGLWFDFAGQAGLKKKEGSPLSENEPAHYTVVLLNEGSVRDTIRLTLSHPQEGWSAALDEKPEILVTLDPREKITYGLTVMPPANLVEGSELTIVTAQSSIPSVLDHITAVTKIEAPSEVDLSVKENVVWVDPGDNATFLVEATNNGEGTANIFLSTQHDGLPGWGQPEVFLRNPVTGRLSPVDQISLSPGQSAPLALAVPSASDAVAGERSTTRLHAGTAVVSESKELFLHTVVRAIHNVTSDLPQLPIKVPANERELQVDLDLTNGGNLDENLALTIGDTPAGWLIRFPVPVVDIVRGGSQTVSLVVEMPRGAKEGEYPLAVRLLSADGAIHDVPFSVEVGVDSGILISSPSKILGQPGRAAEITLNVTNQGNTELALRIAAPSTEAWGTGEARNLAVAPGATRTTSLPLAVPLTASDGSSEHVIAVAVQPVNLASSEVTHRVDIQVDVARADISLESPKRFPAPAGTILQATVRNDGARSAYGAQVQLRDGAEVLDAVTFAEIAPHTAKNASFLVPHGVIGDLALVADPNNEITEADETNNVATVSRETGRDTPTYPWPVLAAAILVCARVMGRRGGRR